jgi:heme/copper-type cytochrome/quinol oxidase subunit 3
MHQPPAGSRRELGLFDVFGLHFVDLVWVFIFTLFYLV